MDTDNEITAVYVKKRISEIEFNINEFNLDTFIEWLQGYLQREIRLVPVPTLGLGVYGRWISIIDKPVEYIFYVEKMGWLTEALTLCHELVHILEKHDTLKLTMQELDMLFSTPFFLEEALARESQNTAYQDAVAEEMAEIFVQKMVENSAAEKSIDKVVSSNHFLADYLNQMGLT